MVHNDCRHERYSLLAKEVQAISVCNNRSHRRTCLFICETNQCSAFCESNSCTVKTPSNFVVSEDGLAICDNLIYTDKPFG
ncbi:hypothetical protein HOLleu_02628 [Holothuria leucospilota]|uniref:Uncharacterized protein n=1 Tax=Holothuria leucospilota TaxID=206669 RepID=A0A9Q1CRJ7_HOLLE|nr:hypothetical protein HOLleu_02628 [Holothuria leucospilota]